MTNMPHGADAPGHEAAADHDGADAPNHDSTDHGEDHGHDDHAHAEEPLGPIDVAAWGAGLLGVIAGALVAACFALATATPT